MSFDFFPNEQSATLLNAARHPSTTPDPGAFDRFLPGAASYGMRSLAEVGRALDLGGSVFPIAADAVTGGTERQDQYFREHDDVFNHAVDYWTPKPGEVGTAGQITGQLTGGVLQAAISPALLVATSQLSTGEDLTRQGVDADTAGAVGGVAGLGTAAGLKLPFLGSALATRVLSGAAGNAVQGAATAGASRTILNASGNTGQAAQYDPTDVRGRLLDALMGGAFGVMAHVGAKLSPTQEAALLVSNQARHLEETTAPGRPATDTDLTQHVDAMHRALDQLSQDQPVSVDRTIAGMQMAPDESAMRSRDEVGDEVARAAAAEAPPVEPLPPMTDATELRTPEGLPESDPLATAATDAIPGDIAASRARALLEQQPDMTIPTGTFDTTGAPETVRVADVMAHNDAETAQAVATAPELFRTAAACLLGVL